MTQEQKVNKDNVLVGLDGTYNEKIHKKLNSIIHNICQNKIRTNPSISLEDLKQDCWLRIYEVINQNLKKGRELEISYLIVTAQTQALGICQKNSKHTENIDDFATMLLSSSDNGGGDSHNQLNVAKAKLEYEISLTKPNESEAADLRISLEDLLENLVDTEYYLAKNLILIKYVKQVNGTSSKIINMYKKFYDTLDIEHRNILDNMDKFTNNAAFKVLNMRATDNLSTKVRRDVENILSCLCV